MSSFKKQSITIKNFSGWISQDAALTTWKQVLYTENLDINSNSYYISLNKESEGRFETTDTVNWFIWAWIRSFAYCDDWKIYDVNDWTVKYTLWDKVYNAWTFNWFIYFLTNATDPLNRISIRNAASNSWTWNVEENISTTGDSIKLSGDIFPSIVLLNEKFYLWTWSDVVVVDKTDVVTSYDIWDWNVVWITRVGWVFKVYTDTWVVAFWDWESSSIDSFIEVQAIVRWVLNDWKTDYILAWKTDFQSRVKVLSWYTIPEQDLMQARHSERLWEYLFRIEYLQTNQWARLANQLYFVQDWIDSKQLVTYWTWNPVVGKWFNIPYSKDSTWDLITQINSIYWTELTDVDRMLLWITTWDWTFVEYIDVNTTSPVYKTNGYLQTNIIDWWSRIQRKKIEAIKIVTSDCDEDNTIELQQSIDWWTFSTVQTINDWSWITKTDIFTKKDAFRDIMFKINFVSDWTNTTPKFYEIQLVYTNID